MTALATVTECVDSFDVLVKSHAKQASCSIKSLRVALDAVAATAKRFGDREAEGATRLELFDRFLSARVSERFAVLDAALFSMRRHFCLSWEFDEPRIVGDFVQRPANARDSNKPHYTRWLSGDLLVRHALNRRADKADIHTLAWCATPGNVRNRILLRCKFPGEIPASCIRLADQCRALAFRALADLWEDEMTGEIVRGVWGDKEITPTLAAYWIPTLDSISVNSEPAPSRRDPALVLELLGHKFLCGLWEMESENPLEAIVREFSSGTVNKTA